MIWILLLVLAHFFYGVVFMFDKYVLSTPKSNPITYSFYVGAMGIAVLVLIPFGFKMPNNVEIFWSLIAGVSQILAFIFFYKALDKGEVSRVVPYVGATTSVFILIFSSLILKEFLTGQQIIAFVLLVLGSLVIGFRKGKLFDDKTWRTAILAGIFFALFWVATKYLFLGTNFISGLIWVRVGVAVIAFSLLLSKKNRKIIFSETKESKPKKTGVFMLGRILNVAGSLFLYGAVFLGSVVLTNALQGLQYVFVLILALLFFKKIPSLKEQFGKEVLIQKIVAIILICAGLGLLVI
ncbi:MAG: EamA family transporter [Candidatus Portnoybacteria bacterium]|nr:EamA family transporter [Candidatus Portnoybacteria bacterium]